MKEFWKSVNIWESYGQEFSVLFFLRHSVFYNYCRSNCQLLSSVLWRCWLGGGKGIRPVKTEQWGAGMVICLERGADLHMAQLMHLPLTVSCFSKIQIGFTFLVPAHQGSPGQRDVKRVCVCVAAIVNCHSTYGGNWHINVHKKHRRIKNTKTCFIKNEKKTQKTFLQLRSQTSPTGRESAEMAATLREILRVVLDSI